VRFINDVQLFDLNFKLNVFSEMVVRCYYTCPLFVGHMVYVYELLCMYFDCLNDTHCHSDNITIRTWDSPSCWL
jgi:hypothetical protein